MSVARALMRSATLGTLGTLVVATAPPVVAQCAGKLISEILVRTVPPLQRTSSDWWAAPVRAMNSIHGVTKPSVVHALLLLQVADRCDPFLLAESERVLRAQPFIADAHITVHDQGDGTVQLLVTTQDEFSFIVATRLSGAPPYVTALTLGDGNFGGNGVSIAASWQHTETREGFGAAYVDYAFNHRPIQLQIGAARGGLGETSYLGDISHPFYSDVQASAWRASLVDLTLLQSFQRADTDAFDVGQTREFGFAGAAARAGTPGSVFLLGAAFSTEYDATGFPATGYDSAVPYDSLFVRYAPRRSVRLNLIASYRALRYARGARLGSVNGTQDLRLGFDVGFLAGHGFGGVDGSQEDFFVSGGLFFGFTPGPSTGYGYVETLVESRRSAESGVWSDAIASFRLRYYHRLTERQTVVADAEFGGGWETTRPFELDLGQPDGGVRGYVASHDAGGQRAAAKLEDRWFLGSMSNRIDLDFVAFADAGRVWAGDVPFGTTTPVKVGVGIGLLAATPVGSRRTYRVDFALPVSPDPYARWVLRVTVVNFAELGATKEPPDVTFGREFVTASSQFTYPR